MKKFIVEKIMYTKVTGYFAVVVEGETRANRVKIISDIQFFVYEHPRDQDQYDRAKANAKAIANGLNMMGSGLELIAIERSEQIEKHGFDALHDSENENGELKEAAMFLLTGEDKYFPSLWDEGWWIRFKNKIESNDKIEVLKVAGAFVAAEIDRIKLEMNNQIALDGLCKIHNYHVKSKSKIHM